MANFWLVIITVKCESSNIMISKKGYPFVRIRPHGGPIDWLLTLLINGYVTGTVCE